MSYNKRTWKNGDIITEEGLNNIENGIYNVYDQINTINNRVEENTTNINTARQNINDIKTEVGTATLNTTDKTLKGAVNEIKTQIKNIEINGYDDTEIRQEINNIKTEVGTEELTTTSKKIKGAINELKSQVETVENNINNIGNVTDEQIKNAINEAIANGDIVVGGLTSTAQALLISILRSAVFISDQSSNITLLESELAKGNGGESGGTTQYTISNNLSNATTSNSSTSINANASYSATITPNDGYTLERITVTMGNTDVTSTAVSGNSINISSVTGNIVITVTTTVNTPSTTTYTVTNNLTNCSTNNSNTSVNSGYAYMSTITANSGYTLSSITVTMGGTNITSTAVSGNSINISSVTGNIVITASAIATSSGTPGDENVIGARNVNAGIKSTVINNDTGVQADNVSVVDAVTFDTFDKAPYINTEYYNPVHYSDEDLIIQYYVTDRDQEDYFLDKYDKDFLVTIDYGGTIFRRKVKAGNHKINLGKRSQLGETYFSVSCIDLSNNYEAAKHYKHLMIVDRNAHAISSSQTYTMTANDLTTYNIVSSTDGVKISDAQGAQNMVGINNMLKAVRDQGYRKIVFYNPNGDNANRYTYYLQPYDTREHAIVIPNGLTVDLNKCKWKQLVHYGLASLLVKFEPDSNDSHITNGYIWGDYDEHIVDKTDPAYPGGDINYEGEYYNGIYLNGAFNSLENLDVAYVTGYNICSGENLLAGTEAITEWTHCYINNSGQEVTSNNDIWTSVYIGLTDQMKQFRYLQGNPSGGYSGLCGKANDEIVIYYDKDRNFIKKEKIRQYGLSLIPSNAKFVRFTLTSDTIEAITNVTAPGFRVAARNYKDTTCWLTKNLKVHDCRTVAYATGTHNHLMIEDCTIENCGQMLDNGRVTPLAIDIEEGLQHSEAFYLKNLNCIAGEKGSTNVTLVTTYDVHVYGNCRCELSSRKTFGLNIHDCTLDNLFLGRMEHKRIGFMMIYNCTLNGIKTSCTDDTTHPETVIKNCKLTGYINNTRYENTHRVTYLGCEIIPEIWGGQLGFVSENVVNSTLNLSKMALFIGTTNFVNSIIDGDGGIKARDYDITLTNCDVHVPCDDWAGHKITLTRCKLYNSYYASDHDYIIKNNCELA